MFLSAHDITTNEQARAYLKRRAADAVQCYAIHKGTSTAFTNIVALAQYLCQCW